MTASTAFSLANTLPRPPVVLVHGALNDPRVWQATAERLQASGWAVLTPTLPGHAPEITPMPADLPEVARRLRRQLADQGVHSALWAGHSMGSLIALEAAGMDSLDEGHHVLGLVLVGTAWPMRVTPALLEMARNDPVRAIEVISGFSHARREPALLQDTATMMREVLACGRFMPARADQPALNLLEHDLALCDSYRGGFETAARVRCRSRIIAGRMDRMTAAEQALGLAEVLNARVETLDGVGHSMMNDDPQGFAEALIRALEQVRPAAGGTAPGSGSSDRTAD